MPPATPSPHRFLASSNKPKSTAKEPRPPSALRRQVTQPTAERDNEAQGSQFAKTPRFSHSKPRTSTQPTRSASPPRPTLVQALRATTRPADDVEEATATEHGDEMLLDGPDQPVPAAETSVVEDQSGQQWSNNVAFSPKRRRIDDGDAQASSAREPRVELPAAGARFPPSFAQATTASTSTEPGSTQRPAFIRQPILPQEPAEPLPEAFSPHRRGQKFVAGGMAATLQQWVLDTGQAAVQSRKGQEYLRGEDYVMRVKVDEVTGSGPFIVRAKTVNGDVVAILLAGGAHALGSESKQVHAGGVVGIRAPTWEIQLDSTTYTVGVDWRIIA